MAKRGRAPVARQRSGVERCLVAALGLFGFGSALAAGDVHIVVLGTAQDAGYPQAGCYRPHCLPAWQNIALRRTASAIAVVDGRAKTKYLIDATPDIGEQLYRLHRIAPDETHALSGVFLTHAHIGHYTGLMHFGREAMGAVRVPVYAMPRMHEFLANNGPWDQLVRLDNIRLHALENGEPVDLGEHLRVTPFLVPHRDEYSETVGYRIAGPRKQAVFIPDIDKWERWESDICDVVRSVDYALLDATFYADGELPGRDMRLVPHPLVTDSMALFMCLTDAEKARVVFIHMNHTNPLLRDDSDARRLVERRGFRVAFEGMRLPL